MQKEDLTAREAVGGRGLRPRRQWPAEPEMNLQCPRAAGDGSRQPGVHCPLARAPGEQLKVRPSTEDLAGQEAAPAREWSWGLYGLRLGLPWRGGRRSRRGVSGTGRSERGDLALGGVLRELDFRRWGVRLHPPPPLCHTRAPVSWGSVIWEVSPAGRGCTSGQCPCTGSSIAIKALGPSV